VAVRNRVFLFAPTAPRDDFPWKTKMANPFEFIQQVRSEASKVVWPTRRETLVTTGMVLLMVVFACLFFVTVDEALRFFVGLVLGIGRHG
jgi:preprotein translocase subunit SecE